MPRAPQRGRGLGALPMTPMIDVVFLLLIFFLLTSRFAAPESSLDTTVASDQNSSAPSPLQPQIIRVRPDDSGNAVFEIGAQVFPDAAALTAYIRTLPNEAGVVIRSDDAVTIQATSDALQAAADAGFVKRTVGPPQEGRP